MVIIKRDVRDFTNGGGVAVDEGQLTAARVRCSRWTNECSPAFASEGCLVTPCNMAAAHSLFLSEIII